jgi:hypothetical protein
MAISKLTAVRLFERPQATAVPTMASTDLTDATNLLRRSGGSQPIAAPLDVGNQPITARNLIGELVAANAYGAAPGNSVAVNTAAIIAAATSIGSRGTIVIQPNVKYDFNALMNEASIPVGVTFLDLSGHGGYDGDKMIGLYDKGDPTAVADISWTMSSGHHAAMVTDNTGKSGSGSGLARVGSWFWTAGRMIKGALIGVRRNAGALQFGKVAGTTDRWGITLRKYAPMEALTLNYFLWASGVSVGIGEYCLSSSKIYKSTTAGITGAGQPVHTSGSAHDGGVTWEKVDYNYDSTVFQVSDLGHIATNAPTGTDMLRIRQGADDPTATYFVVLEPTGNSKDVTIQAKPTSSGGAPTTITLLGTPTGWDFSDGRVKLLGARYQSFVIYLIAENASGLFKHAIRANFGDVTFVDPAMVSQISGANWALAETPTVDAATNFVNGLGRSTPDTQRLYLNTPNANAIATEKLTATVVYNTLAAANPVYVGVQNRSYNVNGTTMVRPSLYFTTASGVGLPLTYAGFGGGGGTDRVIAVKVEGWIL